MSKANRSEPFKAPGFSGWCQAKIGLAFVGLLLLLTGCSPDDGSRALPNTDGGGSTSPASSTSSASSGIVEVAQATEVGASISKEDQDRISELAVGLAGLATVDWTSEERNAQAKTDGLDLPDDELRELFDVYEQFLATRNEVRLGSFEALEPLHELASASVVRQAEQWRDQNQELEEFGAHIGRVESFPNAMIVAGDDQQVTINDCLEERIGSATMLLGATNYVDQIVTFTNDDDSGWLVSAVEVRHDGTVDENRPGCIPSIHAGEVERVAADYLGVVDGLWQEPTAGSPSLARLASEEVQAEVNQVLEAMVEAGVHVPQSQLHQVAAVGSDPTYGNAWFLVKVCTSLPEGLSPTSVETGQPVPAADGGYEIAPGSAILRELLVLLEADDSGEVSGTVSRIETDSTNSNCDKD